MLLVGHREGHSL